MRSFDWSLLRALKMAGNWSFGGGYFCEIGKETFFLARSNDRGVPQENNS